MPSFTILTATYNAAASLPRLLSSLASQTCRDFELVLQDGGSGDGTVALAESCRDRLPSLSVASERDSGIYDAWNRALPRVRGEWVLFLGADDELADATVLEQCLAALRDAPAGAMYAGGGVDLVGQQGEVIWHAPYRPDTARERMRDEGMPFPNPGLFHHRDLFTNDRFDTSLRIAADYDFLCRHWTPANGSTVLPCTVSRMRRGGLSDTPQSQLRVRWETLKVAARYFPGIWTPTRCTWLLKGCLLWLIPKLVGTRNAPKVLDRIRRWRGLPPVWSGL